MSGVALNQVVSAAFLQGRKTIANTLERIMSLSILEELDIALTQRPETISVNQYIAITQAWQRDLKVIG